MKAKGLVLSDFRKYYLSALSATATYKKHYIRYMGFKVPVTVLKSDIRRGLAGERMTFGLLQPVISIGRIKLPVGSVFKGLIGATGEVVPIRAEEYRSRKVFESYTSALGPV